MLGLSIRANTGVAWPWPASATFGLDFERRLALAAGARVPFTGAFSINRARAKYVTGPAGGLVLVPEHTPALGDRGLLVEAEATNLCNHSTNLSNAAWFKTSLSLGSAQDPTGGTNASRLTDTAANATLSRSMVTVTPGPAYTLSRLVRRGSFDWLRVIAGDSSFSHSVAVWFNLATAARGTHGVAGTAMTHLSSGVTPVGMGYLLVWITFSTTLSSINIGSASAQDDGASTRVNLGSGPGIGGYYDLWNTQLELGSYASSAIVTGATAETRPADALSIPAAPSSGMLTVILADGTVQSVNLAAPLPVPFIRPELRSMSI